MTDKPKCFICGSIEHTHTDCTMDYCTVCGNVPSCENIYCADCGLKLPECLKEQCPSCEEIKNYELKEEQEVECEW